MVLLLEGLSPSYLSGPFNTAAVFPDELGVNSESSHSYKTRVHDVPTGEDFRYGMWQLGYRTWNVKIGLRDFTTLAKFLRFVRGRTGSYEGFRVRDPHDWTTASDGISVPLPDANLDDQARFGCTIVGDSTYQLTKSYVDGPYERVRPITHPIAPGQDGHMMRIYKQGVEQAEGTDCTVDYDTGLVTFATSTSGSERLKWAGTFHVPARFGVEIDRQWPMRIDSPLAWSVGTVPIIELAQETQYADPPSPGGVFEATLVTGHQITLSAGRLQLITPTNNTSTVWLPHVDEHPLGGGVLTLVNASQNFLFRVEDWDGNEVLNVMPPGEVRQFWLRSNP